MKTGDILVIDKIEEAKDNKGKTYLKLTDKAGITHNIKEGRTNLLTNKGHLLKEGVAVKVQLQDYRNPDGKVFPFISDFELIKDIFLKEAAEKFQTQTKDSREDSIERQVAVKCAVELLVGKVIDLDHPLSKAAISWALGKLEEKKEEPKTPTEITDKAVDTLHNALQSKSTPSKEQSDSKPQGTPQEAVMADLNILYDHKPRIWSASRMLKELEVFGFTGAKVSEGIQSLSPDKLQKFHEIVKKVLPKEVK